MDPGRRKRGIYKGVVGCCRGGLRAWEMGSDLEENSQSLVNDETRASQGLRSPGSGGKALRKVRGGVEDLTWFPLVPGGPSFPG